VSDVFEQFNRVELAVEDIESVAVLLLVLLLTSV